MARMKQIKIEHATDVSPAVALALVARVVAQGKISTHKRQGMTIRHYTWITTIQLAGAGVLSPVYVVEVRPKARNAAADSFVVRLTEPNA